MFLKIQSMDDVDGLKRLYVIFYATYLADLFSFSAFLYFYHLLLFEVLFSVILVVQSGVCA